MSLPTRGILYHTLDGVEPHYQLGILREEDLPIALIGLEVFHRALHCLLIFILVLQRRVIYHAQPEGPPHGGGTSFDSFRFRARDQVGLLDAHTFTRLARTCTGNNDFDAHCHH